MPASKRETLRKRQSCAMKSTINNISDPLEHTPPTFPFHNKQGITSPAPPFLPSRLDNLNRRESTEAKACGMSTTSDYVAKYPRRRSLLENVEKYWLDEPRRERFRCMSSFWVALLAEPDSHKLLGICADVDVRL